MTTNLDLTIACIDSTLVFLTNFFTGLFTLVALILINLKMALLAFSTFGFIYLMINFLTKDLIRKNSTSFESAISLQLRVIQEAIGSIKDIILNNNHDLFISSYEKVEEPKWIKMRDNQFLSHFPRFTIESFAFVIMSIIGYLLSRNNDSGFEAITLLGVFALGSQKLLPSLQGCYGQISHIRSRAASVIAVLGYLNQPLPKIEKDEIKKSKLIFENISLNNVHFSYDKKSPAVLKNIDFTINAKEIVGIIGPSGSGKSTLIDILMGLLPPTKGSIKLNGKNLDHIKKRGFLNQYHSLIGHVPQSVFLSNRTIQENIAFGVEYKFINKEKIINSAKLAQIDSFIDRQPHKYETIFGEDGSKLSGGQKQRIGIARAIYKDASILVLDEATSSLDENTERAFIESLEKLSKKMTIIIIAHRLSTIKICNRLIEINRGEIVSDKKL